MTSEVTGTLGTVARAAPGRLCIHEAVTASVSPPETLPTPARMSSCWTPVITSVVPSVLSPVRGHLQESPVPAACPVSVTGLCELPPHRPLLRSLVSWSPHVCLVPVPSLGLLCPTPTLCAPTPLPSHAAPPLGAASTRTASSSSSFKSSGPREGAPHSVPFTRKLPDLCPQFPGAP